MIGCETAMAAAPEPKKKRTEVLRVNPEYINFLLKQPPRQPFLVWSDETIDGLYADQPERGEQVRRHQAETAALMKRLQDEEADVLRQYRTKGYAEVEVELRDDDVNGDDDDSGHGSKEVEDTTAGDVVGHDVTRS